MPPKKKSAKLSQRKGKVAGSKVANRGKAQPSESTLVAKRSRNKGKAPRAPPAKRGRAKDLDRSNTVAAPPRSPEPPAKKWATAADLPAEIKLMIFSLLELDGRVIIFNCSYPTPSYPTFDVWLAEPVKPSVLLNLCHETRSKALPRYSSLTGTYQDCPIDYTRDIVRIVPQRRTRSARNGNMEAADIKLVQNIGMHGAQWDGRYLWENLLKLGKYFTQLRNIHLNNDWHRATNWSEGYKGYWEDYQRIWPEYPEFPAIRELLM